MMLNAAFLSAFSTCQHRLIVNISSLAGKNKTGWHAEFKLNSCKIELEDHSLHFGSVHRAILLWFKFILGFV
jgi:hypothetical protein